MSEGHYRGFGARSSAPIPINTADLVEDIARARDSATGDMKKLLKRAGRRIEVLEVFARNVLEHATPLVTKPGQSEDER